MRPPAGHIRVDSPARRVEVRSGRFTISSRERGAERFRRDGANWFAAGGRRRRRLL